MLAQDGLYMDPLSSMSLLHIKTLIDIDFFN